MKIAIVAGLIAMALGAASSATAQETKKEMAPGANTTASKQVPLPVSGSAVLGQQGVIGGQGGQSAAKPADTGVAQSNAKGFEKARNN